jgi:predicted heme/steroid binding protein/uncharacterized membrane protein
MKEFDQQSLTEFDGSKDDAPVYIAREGKVYDVTASKLWKTGMHMNRHKAGLDLTAEFPAAPHGEEVFERFPQIGVLGDKKGAAENQLPLWLTKFLNRYIFFKRHPHPMLVHYPIVFMFSAPGFLLLALITGNRSFEVTALHCLGAGLIFMPLTMASGFLTWWINYHGKPIRPVTIKIWTSFILLLVAFILFTWRMMAPDILSRGGSDSFFYIFLVCTLAPLVSIIGWFGAKLTFPLAREGKKGAGTE